MLPGARFPAGFVWEASIPSPKEAMVAPQPQPQSFDQPTLDGRLLGIYLRDHLAASVGGAELARRTLDQNRGTSFEPALQRLVKDIEEDRQTLIGIMQRLGVTPSIVKQAAVWGLEKVARLKLNGRLLSYSPLSRLVEFEALGSGIDGKRALWAALAGALGADTRLDHAQLKTLEKRATDQRKRVEVIRLEAARLALSPALAEEQG